jgi:hypothetical protein
VYRRWIYLFLISNGERCKGIAAAVSDYCPTHDPARAEARKRAASKAARSRHSGTSGEIAEHKGTVNVTNGVLSPAFGPDGQILATADKGRCQIWSTGQQS